MSDVGCVTVAGRLVAVTNTDVENNNKTHSLTIKMESYGGGGGTSSGNSKNYGQHGE